MSKNKYPQGAFFNLPHEKAPDFVKGQINISDKGKFIDWLQSQDGNSVKLSLKTNREGKGYAELDTYEPKNKDSKPRVNEPVDFDDKGDGNLPF